MTTRESGSNGTFCILRRPARRSRMQALLRSGVVLCMLTAHTGCCSTTASRPEVYHFAVTWLAQGDTASMAAYGERAIATAGGRKPRLWGSAMTLSHGSNVDEALRQDLERWGTARTVDSETVQGLLEPYREALEKKFGCSRTVAHWTGYGGSPLYATMTFGPTGAVTLHVLYRVDVYWKAHDQPGRLRYEEVRKWRSNHGQRFAWCGFESADGWVLRALLPWDDTPEGRACRRDLVEKMLEYFRKRTRKRP